METGVNIGTMDTRIAVYECITEVGDIGQKKNRLVLRSNVFAAIERSINEQVSNSNLEAGDSITATIYKIHGLTTRWQVKIDGRMYSIAGIDPIDRYSPFCRLTLYIIE